MTIMKDNRHSIFLSYSRSDVDFADRVRTQLKDADIDVWMDEDSLNVGEEWRDGIDKGIAESDAMIVIITPDSCKSPYVTYEWAYALGQGKRVIPVLRQGADIHPRLEVLHYLDFTDPRRGPWNRLFNEIKQSKKNNDEKINSTDLVGRMTVSDLRQLLSGVVSLANAAARTEGRDTNQGDVSEAAANIASANVSLGRSTVKSRTILWVDDHPENNVFEREAFMGIGFRFELAFSTDEAIERLQHSSYAAVISDMGRAEGPREGYVLLEKLRAMDPKTPYFIYAGSDKPEHKQEARQRGAQGTTNKPMDLIELVTKQVSKS